MLDLKTGAISESFAPDAAPPTEAARSLFAPQEHKIERKGETKHVTALWLQAADPPQNELLRVLVAADIEQPAMTSDATRIAYVREGSLYVCDLVQVPGARQ